MHWFCRLKGNEFFCEVEESYINDDFNLSGLGALVPYYEYALDFIREADSLEVLTEAQQEVVENAAEILYGLIHARYIVTARGLAAMAEKFRASEFGRCPRMLCHGQPCLPVGLSDVPRQATVKLFCPKCEDVFYPRSKLHGALDGAFFGTTFPHLLTLTYPALRPARSVERYTPRVFGFKIHPSAFQAAGQTAAERKLRRVQPASRIGNGNGGAGAPTAASAAPATTSTAEGDGAATAAAEDATKPARDANHSAAADRQAAAAQDVSMDSASIA